MGEYIKYANVSTKLGTCENLGYSSIQKFATAGKLGLLQRDGQNSSIADFLDPKYGYRWRFPFPDEDNYTLGADGPEHDFQRGVPVILLKEPGQRGCCDCYDDSDTAEVLIVQQKLVRDTNDKLELWTVIQCPKCGGKSRIDRKDAAELCEAIAENCIAPYMIPQPKNASFWTKIANRILQGYNSKEVLNMLLLPLGSTPAKTVDLSAPKEKPNVRTYKFEGSKYRETRDLPMIEICKLVRADLKEVYPDFKFSVRKGMATYTSTLDVYVKNYPPGYEPGSEPAKEMIKEVKTIVNAYNMDDSDAMTDYFHVRFYDHVGYDSDATEWTPQKNKKPVKSQQIASDGKQISATVPANGKIEIWDYSKKAFCVIGDTKPYKDILGRNGLNGRFNPRLTDPTTGEKFAGWIFSKRHTEIVRTKLGL